MSDPICYYLSLDGKRAREIRAFEFCGRSGIIDYKLSTAGWSWGYCSAVTKYGWQWMLTRMVTADATSLLTSYSDHIETFLTLGSKKTITPERMRFSKRPPSLSDGKPGNELALWHYFPGGRNLTVLFVAWSTSSGVINTVIRDLTAAVALAVNDSADASTLLGRSTMTTKSSLPKA